MFWMHIVLVFVQAVTISLCCYLLVVSKYSNQLKLTTGPRFFFNVSTGPWHNKGWEPLLYGIDTLKCL